MTQETWKPISEFEGLYEISDFGKVRSVKNGAKKERKSIVRANGFHTIKLTKDGKSKNEKIHRLVYQHFVGDLDSNKVIQHSNGNKSDNKSENLVQVTKAASNALTKTEYSNNKTGFRGVSETKKGKFKATLKHEGTEYHLGYHPSTKSAAQAYNNKCIELGLPESRLNRIPAE